MKNRKQWHEYTHMAFDLDGTLLNTNLAHIWSWQDALERDTIFIPHFTLFMQMGLPGKQIVEKFSFLLPDKDTAQRVSEGASEIYAATYVEHVALFDGAIELLDNLKKRKKKLYAITSASKLEADSMLKRFGLDRYFDDVLTAEESGEGKPTPDPFIRLKEKLGAKAEILSFGDSPYDLKATESAGLEFVYLGHGGYPREWFEHALTRFFNINMMLETLPNYSRASAA
jgi:HAD superfamily hydrolase (TIGR01509 family)